MAEEHLLEQCNGPGEGSLRCELRHCGSPLILPSGSNTSSQHPPSLRCRSWMSAGDDFVQEERGLRPENMWCCHAGGQEAANTGLAKVCMHQRWSVPMQPRSNTKGSTPFKHHALPLSFSEAIDTIFNMLRCSEPQANPFRHLLDEPS